MRYLKSAVLPADYPEADRPEVAVVGRSNAGKSSFLNALAQSSVARVSQEPGKTRLLNFFDYGNKYRWVDSPGYGYAARGLDEIEDWQKMMESYFSLRGTLVGIVLLMDLRRKWQNEEESLRRFAASLNLPMILLLTKSDKVRSNEAQKFLKERQRESGLENVFLVSSQTKRGVVEAEEFIYREWILPDLSVGAEVEKN